MLVPRSFHRSAELTVVLVLTSAIAAALLLGGCARSTTSTPAAASDPRYRADLEATVAAPDGWLAQPVDRGDKHVTQVWVSPTGDTALGVIRFTLPLPVGHEWALWGFMQNMRKSEGRAELIEKRWDKSINALRFVAEGGRYRVRAILRVDGVRGWSVFAGTLTSRPVNADELQTAETARDAVHVGP